MEKKLVCFTHGVHELAESEKRALYLLTTKYFENVSLDYFYKSLGKMETVFLLREKQSMQIKGFSTLAKTKVEFKGKNITGFYSGMTVVDSEFWGAHNLGVQFFKYLFKQMLSKPLTALYWLFPAIGDRSYFFLANNFSEYYPSREKSTPKYEKLLMDCFGKQLYGIDYNIKTGCIKEMRQEAGLNRILSENLKLVRLDGETSQRNSLFYRALNPSWYEGAALLCMGRMSWRLYFSYRFKQVFKHMHRRRKKLVAASDV